MPGKVLVVLVRTGLHKLQTQYFMFEVHLSVSVVAIEMKYFPLQLLIR